jgi:Domain of unknown function (DUF4149)
MWCQRFLALLAALWWGGLTGISFLAVPLAFAHFASPVIAGPYAARLFHWQAWGSMFVTVCVLFWTMRAQRQYLCSRWSSFSPGRGLSVWLLLAFFAALLQEFGVAERILMARSMGADVRFWHMAGTLLVFLQWLSALRVCWFFTTLRHR